jgi:cysteine desulfurase
MVPVELVGVDCHGVIDLERLKELLLGEVCLVSIMAANNEIGTVEPLKEISRLTGAAKVPFHSDAVQAFGQIPLSVKETGVDMLSGAAHKLGGPKGVGFLYVREEMELLGMIKGGEQERGKRAGTENVAGIVGFGKACEMAMYKMEEKIKHETMLRDYMIHEIEKRISGVHLNGSRKCRLPNNIHFTFDKVRGDALLALLEEQGILASAGSACNSSNTEPSHVLTEIGLDEEAVRNSLRFTIQPDMKIRQIDYVVDAIVQSVHYLRSITP